MVEECTLYELDREYGEIYINSGPEDRMIEGAQELARQFPAYRYVVKRGGATVWPAEQKSAPGKAGDATLQNG